MIQHHKLHSAFLKYASAEGLEEGEGFFRHMLPNRSPLFEFLNAYHPSLLHRRFVMCPKVEHANPPVPIVYPAGSSKQKPTKHMISAISPFLKLHLVEYRHTHEIVVTLSCSLVDPYITRCHGSTRLFQQLFQPDDRGAVPKCCLQYAARIDVSTLYWPKITITDKLYLCVENFENDRWLVGSALSLRI